MGNSVFYGGTLYVAHNDSPVAHAALDVYDPLVLLGKMVVDTEMFQLGAVPDGCVMDKYPAVIVTGKQWTPISMRYPGIRCKFLRPHASRLLLPTMLEIKIKDFIEMGSVI